MAQAGRAPADPLIPFFSLYRRLCDPVERGSRVLGHLGQSIDGYIATASGDSDFVNDQENIRHLHRLRALHDAVIVGAGTIAADNPQLTTRRVPGPNPVRVVLDPQRRLPETSQVFTDGVAQTLLVVAEADGGSTTHSQAEVVVVPTKDGLFNLAQVVECLADRGWRKLFVEGGGTTVSRFFDAGLLDRLQIAVAPVLMGRGKPGLRLAPKDRLDDCPRPKHRVFAMGHDILFDCDLAASEPGAIGSRTDQSTGEPTGTDNRTTFADSSVPIRRIR